MSKTAASKAPVSSPIVAIYQWLSYAFWGWVAIATATLIGVSSSFMINGYSPDYEAIAYVIAAAFVVLPIAFVSDILFSRHEKDHKSSGGMIIMVIHAVLYSLIAVGSLATVVFSFVSLVLTDETDLGPLWVTIISAVSLFILFATLVLRIMRPAVDTPFRLIVRYSLSAIVVGAIIWGIIGPVSETLQRRDDQRTIVAVDGVANMINNYVSQEGMLPETLTSLLESDVSQTYSEYTDSFTWAIDNERLTYTPNVIPSSETETDGMVTRTFAYELCATFDFFDEDRSIRGNYGYDYRVESPDVPDGFNKNGPRLTAEAGTQCSKVLIEDYPVKAL